MLKTSKPKAATTEKMKKKVQIKDLPATEKSTAKVKGGAVGPCDRSRK